MGKTLAALALWVLAPVALIGCGSQPANNQLSADAAIASPIDGAQSVVDAFEHSDGPVVASDAANAIDANVTHSNETTLTGTMVTNVGAGHALWLVNGTTEIWNGSQWNGVNVASPPLPRVDACMALDVARSRVVLFGGYSTDHSIDLGDTWTWDGSVWLEAHPVHSPGRLHGAGMAYDSARQRVVLFGGVADSTALSATWEWDGTDWTQQTPTTSPPASLNDAAMTYDPDVSATVLFANDGTT